MRARARRLRAQAGPLLALAVLVLVTAFAAAAWPRASQEVLTAALRAQVTGTGPAVRDLLTSITPGEFAGARGVELTWAAMPQVTDDVQEGLPAALQPITGPVRYFATSAPVRMTGYPGDPPGTLDTAYESDPDLGHDVEVVSGALPSGGPAADGSLPVAVSTATAAEFHWRVGQVLHFAGSGPADRVVVAGIVRARTPSDDYWRLEPLRLAPQVSEDSHGNYHWQSVAFVAATGWTRVATRLPDAAFWTLAPLAATPRTAARLTVMDLPAVSSALAAEQTMLIDDVPDIPPFSLASQLDQVFTAFTAAASPVAAVSAVVATGPLATLVVLLGIALAIVGGRRARSDRLITERGGSALQVRGAAAADVALVSVPGALAGTALGLLATPAGSASPLPALLATALIPPVVAAVLTERGTRRRRPRLRLIVECLTIGIAALGVTVLLQRGVSGVAPDPVVVVTPLLVALAVCVPLLRAFPVLVRSAGRLGARGAGIAGLLGSRLVAAGGGAAALVAVVAAVGIASASVGVLGTVRLGIADTAVHAVGADLIVTDIDGLPSGVAARLRAMGADTAEFDLVGGAVLKTPAAGVVDQVVFAADPAAVARVQDDLPDRDRTFAAFRAGTGLTIGTGLHGRTTLPVGGLGGDGQVTARLVPVPSPGAITRQGDEQQGYWVVADRTLFPRTLLQRATPAAVLARLPAGADAAGIAARVQRIAPAATVLTVAGETARISSAPLLAGLEAVVVVAAVLAAAGAALALALSLIAASRARTRLAATLRAIGLSSRQSAALVVWDAVPVAVAGLVVGVVAGVGAAALLLIPVDVAPIIGAASRPPFALDPLLLAAVAGVTLGAAAIGTLAALAAARRADVAAVLRFTEGER